MPQEIINFSDIEAYQLIHKPRYRVLKTYQISYIFHQLHSLLSYPPRLKTRSVCHKIFISHWQEPLAKRLNPERSVRS